LKNLDFCLNLETIHESDVPALSILLSQCKFNSIFFHGNNPEKPDLTVSKSVLLKKSMNSLNGSSSESKIKKANKGFYGFW